MKSLYLILVLGLVTGVEGDCNTCHSTYTTARDAGGATETDKCNALKAFMTCLESASGTGCPLTTARATEIATDFSGISCSLDPLCICQKDYWATDLSASPGDCTGAKARVSCLRGKTGTGCDGSSAINVLGTTTASIITALTTCASGLSAACTCEKDYVAADVSNNAKMCTETQKFVGCLKTLTGGLCSGSVMVADAATAGETVISNTASCTPSDGCLCEISYAKADISDNTKKCTETKKYISCLKTKTGTGCDGTTTVAQLATAAETFAGTLTSCTLANTACGCETTYAKADISDNTKLCTETKTYVACLKDKAGPGCVSTDTTVALATAAETTMSGITGGACAIANTVCFCDVQYAKADVSDNAKKCTANKDYISCLLGKTGTGCDGSTTLINLATAAETAITTIGASCTKTSVCDCEIVYAKANIGTNADKCTATKALTTCIQASIDGGCGSSTTKTNVGTVAQAAFTALTSANCAQTPTCLCQSTFNAASVTAANKCTSARALTTCLAAITSTTETACDGSTLTADLKTSVKTSVESPLCSTAGIKVEASFIFSLLMLVLPIMITSL